jgi:NAD-dependent DNA ligase
MGSMAGILNPLEAIPTERKTKGVKQGLTDFSASKELPCYGYIFPFENIFDLRRETKKTVTYKIIHTQLAKEYNQKESLLQKLSLTQKTMSEITNIEDYVKESSKIDRPSIWLIQPNIFRYKISISSVESRENINKLLELLRMKETGRMLEGKKFYFKGRFYTFGKEHAGRLVKALGGRVTGGIVKDLSYLVTNSTKTKDKHDKAQERGTKIITEVEFLKMFE